MKDKKMNQTKRQQEDLVTNRVLAVFGITAVLIWGLSAVARGFDYSASYRRSVLISKILVWLGAVGVVGGLAWFGLAVKKGVHKKGSIINGAFLAWVSLAVGLSAFVMCYYDFTLATRLIYILYPVGAILYLIYAVYPREFFTIAFSQAVLVFLMWMIAKTADRSGVGNYAVIALILGLIVCGILLALYYASRKNHGRIKVANNQVEVFGQKARAAHIVTVYAVTAALLVAAFALGAPYAFYAMYAQIGYIFVAAVYYTVCLM